MYKILICDNEKMEINNLITTIEGADNGFSVCDVVCDGLRVLEAVQKLKPELVFLNIRMPGLNYLEMLKKSGSINVHTLFVVMDSHEEFADIQKAINCGAIGCLLKPFAASEIMDVLDTAKHYIDSERAYAETRLLSLISEDSNDNTEEIATMLMTFGFEWSRTKNITVLVSKNEDVEMLLSGFTYIRLRLQQSKSAYLIETPTLMSITRKLENFHISAGISNSCHRLRDLCSKLYEASIASDQPYMTGKSGIYFYRDLQNTDMKLLLSRMQVVLKNKEADKTKQFFDFVGQCFTTQGYSVIHAYEFYNMVIFHLYDDEKCNMINGAEKLALKFKNINEELDYLRNLLVKSPDSNVKNINLQIKNKTFCYIVTYINENFNNEQLSLQTIACKFTINSNYVSQLFKKETGMTFTEYLTKLRLKNATHLLKNTTWPVCIIAEKSGFNDYFYFARIFKKYTGKTSTIYRELYQNVTYLHEAPLLSAVENSVPSAIRL